MFLPTHSLKVCKETLLSCDTSFTARAIVQLYVNVMARDGFSNDDGDNEESLTDRGAVDFREVSCTFSCCRSSFECLDLWMSLNALI